MKRLLITFTIATTFVSAWSQSISTNLEQALKTLSEGSFVGAFTELNKIAFTNNVIAQFYIGQCYEYGIGTELNWNKAFIMYRKAAERGFALAMKSLSNCYKTGIGVETNSAKAEEWLKRYKAKRNSTSYPDLIEIYNQGLHAKPLTADNTKDKEVSTTQAQNKNQVTIPASQINSTYNSAISNNLNGGVEVANDVTEKKSDVDIEIPVTGMSNQNTFAVIIANELYQHVVSVPHAFNDGGIFAEYCEKTLGLPKENIHLIKDATFGNIKGQLRWMRETAMAYKSEASFIFYYAGHGIPDEKTHNGYLVPTDGEPKDLETCISLASLYKMLGDLPSKKTITFLDACFSGSQRGSGMLLSARGISIKMEPNEPQGNMVVISSAQEDETAYPYEEQNHGLFTYFLLKSLKESKGNVTLGELADFVIDNVRKKSIVTNGKSQTPIAAPATGVASQWTKWTLM